VSIAPLPLDVEGSDDAPLALECVECQQAVTSLEETVPTYQYACTACGHQLEAVQSFADEPLCECPACAGRLRKVFNSVGIVFKGSGFYRTDSRGKDTNGADSGSSNGSKESKEPAKADSGSGAASGGAGAATSTTATSTGSTSSSTGGTAKPAVATG